MTLKRFIIGYIVSYIFSEIFVFIPILCNCLRDGWHRIIDFAWWQIGMPAFAIGIYVIFLFCGYLFGARRY